MPRGSRLPCRPTWLQSRRMREPIAPDSMPTDPSQQVLITRAFAVAEVAEVAAKRLIPALDRDRAEYLVASALLEEEWVGQQ